jgi:hypothetical protein
MNNKPMLAERSALSDLLIALAQRDEAPRFDPQRTDAAGWVLSFVGRERP